MSTLSSAGRVPQVVDDIKLAIPMPVLLSEIRAMLPDQLQHLRPGSVATLTDYPARCQVEGIRANLLFTVSDLKTGV